MLCWLMLCLVSSLLLAGALDGACSDDNDCEYLGSCEARVCQCLPGFSGPTCSSLALAPASAQNSRLWPRGPLPPSTPVPSPSPPSPGDFNASAWGASVVYDEHDGLWHAMVDSACGVKGVLASGGAGSFIAHLTSPEGPDRGFSLKAMATPTTSFGPHLARDPETGKFVLIFRVNALVPRDVCAGNFSEEIPDPMPADFVTAQYVRADQLEADPTGRKGQNFYVMWADRMTGPWQVQKIEITGDSAAAVLTDSEVHVSNNALFFPKPGSPAFARGTVGMAFRYNPDGGSHNGYAVADSFLGPYTAIANLSSIEPHGSEDPFVFELDMRGRARSLHMIWHCKDHGYHAWSVDGGATWQSNANAGVHLFELNVSYDDGSSAKFKRRERPEILFDKNGLPAFFISGVQVAGDARGDGTAYPLIEALTSAGHQLAALHVI